MLSQETSKHVPKRPQCPVCLHRNFSGLSGGAQKHPESPRKLRLQFVIDRRKIQHFDYFLWYNLVVVLVNMITCCNCHRNPLRKCFENHRIWISWLKNCFTMCNGCHFFTACTFTIMNYIFYFQSYLFHKDTIFSKSSASLVCRKM